MSLKGCLGGAATTQVIYTLPVLSIIAIVADIVCTFMVIALLRVAPQKAERHRPFVSVGD